MKGSVILSLDVVGMQIADRSVRAGGYGKAMQALSKSKERERVSEMSLIKRTQNTAPVYFQSLGLDYVSVDEVIWMLFCEKILVLVLVLARE